MGRRSLLETAATEILDLMSAPAILVHGTKRIIVACNHAAHPDVGQSENAPVSVEFVNIDPARSTSADCTITRHNGTLIVTGGTGPNHSYRLLRLNRHLALLYCPSVQRPAARNATTTAANIDYIADAATGGFYHVSYIHSLADGKRKFSSYVNLEMLGIIDDLPPENGVAWRDVVSPGDLAAYDNAIDRCIRDSGDRSLSYSIRARNGREFLIDDYFGTITAENRWPVLVGSILSGEKLGAINATIQRQALAGRLVGSMIHDFRNLLAGIQNIVQWCVSESPRGSKVSQALQKTVTYTDLSNRLMTNTLRLLGGKEQANVKTTVDIGEMLLDLEELIRQIMSPAIEVLITVEPGLPSVCVIPSVFQDSILNLCINARDAMRACGNQLTIKCYYNDAVDNAGAPGSNVVVEVADNGCGLDSAIVTSIFNAYYSTKDDGTGLGLWMVKESVAAFGGTIAVESDVGKGAVFRITLPTSTDSAPRAATVESSGDSVAPEIRPFDYSASRTILLIEDEPLIRNGLITWLESFGFRLLCADDGAAGWELFEQNSDRIDLIIQDYVLPGKRGEELLTECAARRPDLPIIVISGFTEGKNPDWLLSKGAFAFLAKPFKIEKLAALLHDALDD